MVAFLTPQPLALARQRLKSSLGALALTAFARTLFTPYLALRAALVSGYDAAAGSRRGGDVVWWIETVFTLILAVNIAEAAYWLQNPAQAQALQPTTPRGLKLVPIHKSSPLTRSYDASTAPSALPNLTPGRHTSSSTQSPLAQSLYRNNSVNTPTRLPPGATPPPGSPGSGSAAGAVSPATARVLGLPERPASPSSTGLFYDDSGSSPAKAAAKTRGLSQSAGPGAGAAASSAATKTATTHDRGLATVARSDFVVVEREEREWVDNVWKGVRGKSRHVGL